MTNFKREFASSIVMVKALAAFTMLSGTLIFASAFNHASTTEETNQQVESFTGQEATYATTMKIASDQVAKKEVSIPKTQQQEIVKKPVSVPVQKPVPVKPIPKVQPKKIVQAKKPVVTQKVAPVKKPVNRTQVSTKKLTVKAYHYTANCNEGCTGRTALGFNVKNTIYSPEGLRIIAVDRNVIPLGQKVTVTTPYGSFQAIAGDTGGAIRGNKIDILVGSNQEALNRGVVQATVTW